MNTPRTEQAAGTGGFSDFELRRLPDAALEVLAQGTDRALAQRAHDILKRRAEWRAESLD